MTTYKAPHTVDHSASVIATGFGVIHKILLVFMCWCGFILALAFWQVSIPLAMIALMLWVQRRNRRLSAAEQQQQPSPPTYYGTAYYGGKDCN